LRRVLDRDRIIVEVNPADYELVRAEIEALADGLGGFHGLEVEAEPRVGRGGCLVRTQVGEIDAGIDEQLSRAADILRDAVAPREDR
jgi:flagellar biosynthesis/type III secretory pathway protein FliH